jgi:hypothetical protein
MNRRLARISFALLTLAAVPLTGQALLPAAAEPPISGPVAQPAPAPTPKPAPDADTVPAKRYRVPMADSALEWAHGAYTWIEELYLPEQGLVANVRWDYAWKADATNPSKGEFTTTPRMTAFPSPKPRNQYRDLADTNVQRESPMEDIRIPKALADEIAALADLARRVDEAKTKLGAAAADAKWLRRFNPEGAEVPADPSAVPPPGPAMK